MNPPTQPLYTPRRTRVNARGGTPESVAGIPVEAIREEWLVEDRWWTLEPLRRHYFEVVLTTGRNLVIFYTPLHPSPQPPHARTRSGGRGGQLSGGGQWFLQRA